jgi:hypothetical protein
MPQKTVGKEQGMKYFSFMMAAVLAVCAFSTGTRAETLSGTWSGNGFVKPKEGERESVRCKVTYNPEGASTVGVTATCASASTTIHQTGQLTMVSQTRYVGDFYNSEYDISGRIGVTISGSSQTVTFSGARGSGSLSLSKH